VSFRQSQLLRIIAILFLLHSGVDVLFPQLCNDEEPFGGRLSTSRFSPAADDEVVRAFAVNSSTEFPGDDCASHFYSVSSIR